MVYREFHPLHIYEQNTCYFLTASTANHQHLLPSDAHRSILRDILLATAQDGYIRLYAWVVLADHYHLLLNTNNDTPLWKFVRRLHGESAIRLNKLDHTNGRKVWYQYWDRFPRNDGEFWAYFNYIHINPIKHKYVSAQQNTLHTEWKNIVISDEEELTIHTCLAHYPYSSYNYYMREYGTEFLDDVWRRYPIPDYLADEDR